MKIYQLHEHSGEWEDYRDRVIGSYLRKERAEEEKLKAEKFESILRERSDKCNKCPIFSLNPFLEINKLIREHGDYCDLMEVEESDYGPECMNYAVKWDYSTFEVVEVEVEE